MNQQINAALICIMSMSLIFYHACADHQQNGGQLGEKMGQTLQSSRQSIPKLESLQQALEVCPDGETTFGIDVSSWQGEINWDQVANDGVKYAVIRVSAGLNSVDQYFPRNWNESRRVGLLRGVYQYFHPAQDPVAQAYLLVDRLREAGGDFELPPVIDIEAHNDLTAAEIAQSARTWIDIVEEELGIQPMVYTGYYFWQDHMNNTAEFNDHPLWHPQYTSAACPRIPNVWEDWVFWQYSSTGRVAGIEGDVDLNRFNGNEAQLIEWSDNYRQSGTANGFYAGQPRGQSFPLASEDPIELCVGERLFGEIYIDNTGSITWDEQVRLAPIPRDMPSPLWDIESWLSPSRVISANSEVAPGEQGTFAFSISTRFSGEFTQYFGLVAEGRTWFADAGGPRDDYIQLRVNARECEQSPDMMSIAEPDQMLNEMDQAMIDQNVEQDPEMYANGADAMLYNPNTDGTIPTDDSDLGAQASTIKPEDSGCDSAGKFSVFSVTSHYLWLLGLMTFVYRKRQV